MIKKFATHKFGKEDMRALLEGMLEFGLKGEFANYLGAEQATMALGSIVNAMHVTGAITKAQFTAMNKALGGVLVAVKITPLDETIQSFEELCDGKWDHLPESAFMYIGGVEEAAEQARKMAEG